MRGGGPRRTETTMKTISIRCYVPQSVALAASVVSYGETMYQPTAEELSQLSDPERSELAKYAREEDRYHASTTFPSLTLSAAVVAWSAIVDAIRAILAERAAKREQEIASVLALPIEDFVREESVLLPSWHSDLATDPRVVARLAEAREAAPEILASRYLARPCSDEVLIHEMTEAGYIAVRVPEPPSMIASDPRIVERVGMLRTLALENLERALTLKRDRKAVAERKEQAERDAEAGLLEYALTLPDLERSAREGYEVKGAALNAYRDRVDDAIRAIDRSSMVTDCMAEGDPAYQHASWEERSAPSTHALEIRDRVVAAVATVERPSCISCDVSRIMRYEPDGGREDIAPEQARDPYTAILIRITSLAVKRERVIVVTAE